MKSKLLLFFFASALLAMILGTGVSMAAEALVGAVVFTPLEAGAVVLGLKMVYHVLYSDSLPVGGMLNAGLNKEIWLDYLKEGFYRVGTFMQNVSDWSAFVEYNTLNYADAGGDPNVLINNTTYPIPTAQRADTPLTIALDTYDTENTRVRNIEEMESAYNKMDSVIRQHRNTLIQKTHDKAIHAYAPSADTAGTPVLLTGGATQAGLLANDLGITGTFRKFALKDIARLKKTCDLKSWPVEGRCLVLHPNHQMDLIEENQELFKMFIQLATGQVLNLYGFKILAYAETPRYTESTGAKKAFGAAAVAAADTISSVAFLETEVMKAEGDQTMFFKPKEINTEQRADEVGFQKRFIAAPIRAEGQMSIISDRTAA